MKIKKIYSAGKADVWNMEVEETHDFAVENGVIVHNCYDCVRYVLMENPISPKLREENKKPQFDPLDMFREDKQKYRFYGI